MEQSRFNNFNNELIGKIYALIKFYDIPNFNAQSYLKLQEEIKQKEIKEMIKKYDRYDCNFKEKYVDQEASGCDEEKKINENETWCG